MIFTILVFSLSCNKSFPDKLEEPIKSQEIIEWFKGYSQKMSGAPEPVWSSAKKAFDKELMVVRIPLESGGGEIFFGKKMYGNHLEVKFYRQVGTFDSINKHFSGYYETIDMGNYEYHKLDFINGVKVKELRSKSVNLSDDTNSGTTTFDDRPSWLSAFWDCLKQYILSVPKWDPRQNEWICSCFCSDGGSPKKVEDPLSPGGGSIFPPTFFIPPTNLIPPRDWDPFPINPGGVGGGGTPGSGSNVGGSGNNDGTVPPSNDDGLRPGWKGGILLPSSSLGIITSDEKEFGASDYSPQNIWWDDDMFVQNLDYKKELKPSWDIVYKNYPKNSSGGDMEVKDVCSLIGGELNNSGITNACAIRVSLALNYSGISIPEITGQTKKGSDGKNYFLYASHLKNWLNKVFGAPDIHITAAQIGLDANKYYDYLIGIQNRGIYVMKPKSSESFGATGQATLWAGLDCIGGKNYFGAASDVYIWKLPQ